MPHDINGKPLIIGDEVIVRARVRDISLADEYCNVTLETIEPMYPTISPTTIVLNAKQVIKAEDAPPIST